MRLLAAGLIATALAASAPPHSPALAASSPRAVILNEFGGGWLGRCFVSIAKRESQLRPWAANWSDRHSDGSRGSFGLLQIGALHRARGESVAAFARRMFDPVQNVRLGHALYRSSGLRPWGGNCG